MPRGMLTQAGDLLRNLTGRQISKLVKAKKLHDRMASLQSQASKLESVLRSKAGEIESLKNRIVRLLNGGTRGRGTAGPARRRSRKGGTLRDAIVQTLERMKRPLGLTELSKAILAGGHKTASVFANFRTSVSHYLRGMRGQVAKVDEGYALKSAPGKKRGRKPRKETAPPAEPESK